MANETPFTLGSYTLTSDFPDVQDIEIDITISNQGVDSDGDGLTLCQELAAGLDPQVADTDGDGLNDGAEIALGSDPLDADSDNDGLTDGDEVNTYGSSPTSY